MRSIIRISVPFLSGLIALSQSSALRRNCRNYRRNREYTGQKDFSGSKVLRGALSFMESTIDSRSTGIVCGKGKRAGRANSYSSGRTSTGYRSKKRSNDLLRKRENHTSQSACEICGLDLWKFGNFRF